MTAEIAIMNNEAIALAADSAITLNSGEKIFKTSNKLFALSKYHPVGIMIYNRTDFIGIPWETLIKIYKNKIGQKKLCTLEDYSDDFIGFLFDSNHPFIQDEVWLEYMAEIIQYYLNLLYEEIGLFDNEIEDDEFEEEMLFGKIKFHSDYLNEFPIVHNDLIGDKLEKNVDILIENDFKKNYFAKLSQESQHILKQNIINLFSRNFESADTIIEEDEEGEGSLRKFISIINNNYTGIVFAGFGENEIFPSIREYWINGYIHKLNSSDEIVSRSSAIIPFAQDEMVHRFMDGIDPDYESFLENCLFNLRDDLRKNLICNFIDELNKYNETEKESLRIKLINLFKNFPVEFKTNFESEKKMYSEDITEVVRMLPKGELAELAESLVNITSIKRKVSLEFETVGGPIDVAVISKMDGFVWIKRKQYFEPDLNQLDFF